MNNRINGITNQNIAINFAITYNGIANAVSMSFSANSSLLRTKKLDSAITSDMID